MFFGIDVSKFQGNIDWNGVVADKYSFVIVKATQGRSEYYSYRDFVDSRFTANVVGASEAGLRVGVYHFLTAKTNEEARAEARFFCENIEPYRKYITLWACADVESRHLPNDKDALTGIVRSFCSEVEAHGFKSMVYTNPNFLKYRLNPISEIPLWLALWRPFKLKPVGYGEKIWQHGGGRVLGIRTGNVDLDAMWEMPPIMNQKDKPFDYSVPVMAQTELDIDEYEHINKKKSIWKKLYDAFIGGKD